MHKKYTYKGFCSLVLMSANSGRCCFIVVERLKPRLSGCMRLVVFERAVPPRITPEQEVIEMKKNLAAIGVYSH